jgi:probable rRNA maturation factor
MKQARRQPSACATALEILIQSPLWAAAPDARATLRRAMGAVAENRGIVHEGEITALLTDDSAIRSLNRQWRSIDKATNVLAFPARRFEPPQLGLPPRIGDVVIAYETTAREAEAEGKSFSQHLSHLAVHGFLHLLGYDHDSDAAALEMEQLEVEILARLDLPDPYAVRQAGA